MYSFLVSLMCAWLLCWKSLHNKTRKSAQCHSCTHTPHLIKWFYNGVNSVSVYQVWCALNVLYSFHFLKKLLLAVCLVFSVHVLCSDNVSQEFVTNVISWFVFMDTNLPPFLCHLAQLSVWYDTSDWNLCLFYKVAHLCEFVLILYCCFNHIVWNLFYRCIHTHTICKLKVVRTQRLH